MKNPFIAALLGLFTNFFSFLYFDYRLFFMSFFYVLIISTIYCLLCPFKIHWFLLLSSNLFFVYFNNYLVGVWNYMQLDDSYEKPWANCFLFFKRWFLRFIVFVISIFLAIYFIKSGGGFIILSFKLTGLVLLMPSALFLYEYLEAMLISTIFGIFKLPNNG